MKTYLGKNNVVISGMINRVSESEVAGYRVVDFTVNCASSYFSKKDNETKNFTQRVPCRFWDKSGTAPIESGWYVHVEGQIASDKQSGLHVKARYIDRVFEDQDATEEPTRPKQQKLPLSSPSNNHNEPPPFGDDDIPL